MYNTRPRRGRDDPTPPLTPDNSEEIQALSVKEESPSLDPLSSPSEGSDSSRSTPVLELETGLDKYIYDDYLIRSKRAPTVDDSIYPVTLDGWGSWSWSQLKEPVWSCGPPPDGSEDKGSTDHTNEVGLAHSSNEACISFSVPVASSSR